MKYIKKYESIRQIEYNTDILEKFEKELSKYLKVIKYHIDYQDIHTDKIFLIDDDYGCVLSPNTMGRDTFGISIYTVYKLNNKFTYTSFGTAYRQMDMFFNPKNNLEKFVEELVVKLKKQNEIRIKNKENRLLKKTANKYNI